MFTTVSGSHSYGFPSEDSDIDLRACYVENTINLFRLEKPKETIERKDNVNLKSNDKGLEIDFVSFEVVKFLLLMLKGNGTVFEQLYSPIIVVTSKYHDELKALGKLAITKKIYYHYSGFGNNKLNEARKENFSNVKVNLYLFRTLMTGINILETGEINQNLTELNKKFKLPVIGTLIALKKKEEKRKINTCKISVEVEKEAVKLQRILDEAYKSSNLKDDISEEYKEKFNEFLIKVRTENLKISDYKGLL
ncbi:MAG: hypothetical protein BWK75_02775 [Candidatus Altiarchaeales archaeon A3]|nr:MAG: hypothetical protein BWK75_02775 [Candidatus Altiarchaeales archaeon A3]